MWMIQGSSGGGKLGNVCVVGMLSRTFSKTNVRFDTTTAEAEEDIVLQGAGVICSAASCWSDTPQR